MLPRTRVGFRSQWLVDQTLSPDVTFAVRPSAGGPGLCAPSSFEEQRGRVQTQEAPYSVAACLPLWRPQWRGRHRQDPRRSQNSVLSESGRRDCGHLFPCGHSAAAGASVTPSPLSVGSVCREASSFLLVPSQAPCRPVLLECGHHMLRPWGFLTSVSRSGTKQAEKLELMYRSRSSQDTVGPVLKAGVGILLNLNGST